MNKRGHRWKSNGKYSINTKFALAFGVLILLIAQVAITAFSSLNVVIQETEISVFKSVERQRLVYEMDTSLQNARYWERNFFFYWQSIGFNEARQQYETKHQQEIDRVIANGGKLQDLFRQSSLTEVLRQSSSVVEKYIELVNQYSQEFRQAVALVGDIGIPNVGRLAELRTSNLRLQERLRLATASELAADYQQVESLFQSYLATRQEQDLKRLNDLLREVREKTVIAPQINPSQRSLILTASDEHQRLVNGLVSTYQEIDSKFARFYDQTSNLSKQLLDLSAQEIARAQRQIARTNEVSRILLGLAVAGAVTVAGVIARLFFTALKYLQAEQEKSEQLLLNILPLPIANRLREKAQTISDHFPAATVLFADIVGFTEIADVISPVELVEILNVIFSDFDKLAEKHNLEKIKTIGDAYMVVGGLPIPDAFHVEAIAHMALDMQESIAQFAEDTGKNYQIRIGINTGPVIAGVIGTKKYIYDLWGDTVNIASRMETHGLPGKIQVTSWVYHLLKHKFVLEERGLIEIKGKGPMECYLLLGRKQ